MARENQTMAGHYRAGVLAVSEGIESRFEMCLPAEHRVVAKRELPGQHVTEWLVEGSTLPIVAPGARPATVMIELTASWSGGGEYHLDARWRHSPPGDGWHVGDWPDHATFCRFFRVL